MSKNTGFPKTCRCMSVMSVGVDGYCIFFTYLGCVSADIPFPETNTLDMALNQLISLLDHLICAFSPLLSSSPQGSPAAKPSPAIQWFSRSPSSRAPSCRLPSSSQPSTVSRLLSSSPLLQVLQSCTLAFLLFSMPFAG